MKPMANAAFSRFNPAQPGAASFTYQVWVVKPGSSQTYSNAPEIINKGG